HNCAELQELAEPIFAGGKRDHHFVENVPPGTSKSLLHSVIFPAWAWTRMPSFKFLGASYAEDVAQRFALLNRDLVKSDWYRQHFPGVVIRSDQDTKGYFRNTAGGERFAVGSGGGATGKIHAHVIGID